MTDSDRNEGNGQRKTARDMTDEELKERLFPEELRRLAGDDSPDSPDEEE